MTQLRQPNGAMALNNDALDYLALSKSANTARAYETDWKHWTAWCSLHGERPLPGSETAVTNYLASMAKDGYSATTIERRLSSLATAHRVAGVSNPGSSEIVRACLAGIFRMHGSAPENSRPLLLEDIKRMADVLNSERIQDIRDRAVILFGFAAALRRSELAGMRREHLEYKHDGVILRIPKSKTDPTSLGQLIAVPFAKQDDEYCPVLALGRWLDAIGSPVKGPVFRPLKYCRGEKNVGQWGRKMWAVEKPIHDQRIDFIVKSAAKRSGIEGGKITSHSLRCGLATSAADAGVEERIIMLQTRHKSEKQLREYIRSTRVFTDNAAGALL